MKPTLSDVADVTGERPRRDESRAPQRSASPATDGADRGTAEGVRAKIRRLIADRQYFGLDALKLHAGAQRVLVRIAAQGSRHARIDVASLGEDFRLSETAAYRLLRAFLAGGLLHPDGNGGYRATALFRDYASASVVAPLTRERARALVERAKENAERINATWARNPWRIQAIAVSGSYMMRREPLNELSLWLVLRERPHTRSKRWRTLSHDDGLRQIGSAMKALSSYVVVRLAPEVSKVHRPFSVVFDAGGDTVQAPSHGWSRVREWGVSIGRRLGSR